MYSKLQDGKNREKSAANSPPTPLIFTNLCSSIRKNSYSSGLWLVLDTTDDFIPIFLPQYYLPSQNSISLYLEITIKNSSLSRQPYQVISPSFFKLKPAIIDICDDFARSTNKNLIDPVSNALLLIMMKRQLWARYKLIPCIQAITFVFLARTHPSGPNALYRLYFLPARRYDHRKIVANPFLNNLQLIPSCSGWV